MIKFDNATYERKVENAVKKELFTNQMHPRFELLYILNGNGKFIIENTEHPFTNNSMFLVAPGKFHVLSTPPKADYDRIIIYFDQSLLPETLEKNLTFHTLNNSTVRELFLKFDDYSKLYSGKTLEILFKGFLNEVLLTTGKSSVEPSNLPVLIKNAVDYIELNLDKKLSIETIAENLFVSKTHLSHSFSKVMNIGIMSYVQLKRIYKARDMLKNGYSATKVAEILDYKSYPTFLRNYKKHFNKIPSNEKVSK
jgi:AraC-like DNA-binding protein